MKSDHFISLKDAEAYQHADDQYWYRPLLFGDNLFTYVAHVPPGGDMPADAEEAELFELSLYMLEGALFVTYGDERFTVSAGQALFIPRGVPFGVRNDGDTVASFVLTFTPPPGAKSREEMRKRFEDRDPAKIKSPAEIRELLSLNARS